jgi:hypothetical protein
MALSPKFLLEKNKSFSDFFEQLAKVFEELDLP